MEPIIGNGERLPVPPHEQPPPPLSPPSPAAQQQGANTVFYYPVFVEAAPRAAEQAPPPDRPGRAWQYTQLAFVGLTMAGGGVLYGLGHPADAVVSVLIGLGLGAARIVKKLAG